VKEAARLRLLALVDPALAALGRAVRSRATPSAVQIAAARDILDRAGLAAPTKSEMVLAGSERDPLKVVFVNARGDRPASEAAENQADGETR